MVFNPKTPFEKEYAHLLLLAIQQGRVPRYLYKYRTIESLKDYYLRKSEAYFAKFASLNDPYEAYANYATEYSDEDWRAIFRKLGTPPYAWAFLLDTIHSNPDKMHEIIRQCIDAGTAEAGVLCLSAENDNLLLWTHYAAEGKGVCVEFDIEQDPCFFLLPKQVSYSNDIVSLNYMKEQERAMEPLYHKSAQWSYENEYRVIKPGFIGARAFNKEALTSIIFGHAVTQEEIEDVKQKASANGFSQIKYKRAVKGNDISKLDIVEI